VCLNVIDPLTCHLKLRSAISRHKRINMEIASSSDGDSKGMATLKQTPDKDQTASKSLAFHFTFPINCKLTCVWCEIGPQRPVPTIPPSPAISQQQLPDIGTPQSQSRQTGSYQILICLKSLFIFY
jgi:hypothetical protein